MTVVDANDGCVRRLRGPPRALLLWSTFTTHVSYVCRVVVADNVLHLRLRLGGCATPWALVKVRLTAPEARLLCVEVYIVGFVRFRRILGSFGVASDRLVAVFVL